MTKMKDLKLTELRKTIRDMLDEHFGPALIESDEARERSGQLITEPELDEDDDLDETTPPGWEKVVRGLKKAPSVDNPWAVANSMRNKGYKPRKK